MGAQDDDMNIRNNQRAGTRPAPTFLFDAVWGQTLTLTFLFLILLLSYIDVDYSFEFFAGLIKVR